MALLSAYAVCLASGLVPLVNAELYLAAVSVAQGGPRGDRDDGRGDHRGLARARDRDPLRMARELHDPGCDRRAARRASSAPPGVAARAGPARGIRRLSRRPAAVYPSAYRSSAMAGFLERLAQVFRDLPPGLLAPGEPVATAVQPTVPAPPPRSDWA